jgi:Zn-dependent M28 family amino/carboxypeptidase
MKKLSLCIVALSFAACVSAQKNTDPEKFAKFINAEDARKHLSILASDEYEGRETGKPGADKAANYIANEFKKLGLQAPVNGSYFLDIPLVENVLKVSSFSINGAPLAAEKDFFATGADSKTVNTHEVFFIGYGITDNGYDDLKNLDITGKVVLYINDGEPMSNGLSKISGKSTRSAWSTDRAKRLRFLQSKHPELILAVTPTATITAMLKRVGARLSIKNAAGTTGRQQAVAFDISPEAADQLLKSSGKTYADLKKSIDDTGIPQSQSLKADVSASYALEAKDVKAVDVLGFMPGTDLKDEILVFSAHYDHLGLNPNGPDKVYNGADDDGSGTTGILEIARAFYEAKKAGHGPRRSILFLGNVGEEKGLLGSEYYSEHPVFPMANTITDLNIDMIGCVGFEYVGKPDSANYIYTIGSSMLSKELHQINEDANNKYVHLKQDYKYDDLNDPNRFYYRSDHYNFAKHGVPIIFYFNGVHADYHQVTDEIGKINFPLLAKRAQLAFYTGWELANRDKRPIVDAAAQ